VRRALAPAGLGLVLLAASAGPAGAGAYVFANESNGVGIITHPQGYDGSDGPLAVSVCIDPTSEHAAQMVVPVQNALRTWNGLLATAGNIVSGGANNVPVGQYDFESVLLHELGHCLGLAHPNLGVVAGVSGNDRNHTQSTNGSDDAYDLDDGADNVIGSADDQRGDDVNLHWFRISNNDPFTIASVVDATTYSADLGDLPGSDSYAANADRAVGAALGYSASEAVMQQGAFTDEAHRTLGHDDVAALRLAMSGLDEQAGGSDDYTLVLSYAGLTASCDIPIDFDDSQTNFALSDLGGSFLTSNHAAITSAVIWLSDQDFTFFFNQVSNRTRVPGLTGLGLALAAGALLGAGGAALRRRRGPARAG
jgi:hypothetical protein